MEKLKDYLHLYIGCEMYSINENNTYTLFAHNLDYALIYDDKPKLRILHSMTSHEKESIFDFIFPANIALVTYRQKITFVDSLLNDRNNTTDEFILYENIARYMTFYDNCKFINHLISMNFDLFGLIEKGLALDLNKQT